MATLESLQAKIAKLQVQAEAIAKKDSSAVLEKIRELMSKHGLTTADINAHVGGKKRGPKPGAKAALAKTASAARYRDPKSGATWTGHGRAPSWIASAKDRTKYLVEGTSAGSVPAGKPAAKAGSYVRGPQPALYRDPKSGSTWSGRGRAPAWLVDVKDRSKFLIAGADGGEVAPKAVAGKKAAPVKKAAAKKSVAKKAVAKTAVTKKAPAAKKVVASKKAVAKKSSAARQKVATKETAAVPTKRPVVKKVAAKKSVADRAVVTSAEPTAASAIEVSA